MTNKINILGTIYTIEKHNPDDDPKLYNAAGYCETYSKKIIVGNVKDDPQNLENINEYLDKVLRHEIVHAFFFESGLATNSHYATNEELVDWIALQGPKIYEVWQKAEAIK